MRCEIKDITETHTLNNRQCIVVFSSKSSNKKKPKPGEN